MWWDLEIMFLLASIFWFLKYISIKKKRIFRYNISAYFSVNFRFQDEIVYLDIHFDHFLSTVLAWVGDAKNLHMYMKSGWGIKHSFQITSSECQRWARNQTSRNNCSEIIILPFVHPSAFQIKLVAISFRTRHINIISNKLSVIPYFLLTTM